MTLLVMAYVLPDTMRYYMGNILSWPFWQISRLGEKAKDIHDRIYKWGTARRDA
jgi:hypothetical protein